MRVNVDLIFLRIFSMRRPEALMVCRISKACCTVSNPLCRGRRQIFNGFPNVFNERFLDLHSFDSRPIKEDSACCASLEGFSMILKARRFPAALIPRMATALKIDTG